MALPANQLIGPWVDVRSFAPAGHPRDGSKPWDIYIQDAVDSIVSSTLSNAPPKPPGSVGTLYLPPGRYLIDNPIKIRLVIGTPKARRYSFCSIRITGDAPPYGSNDFHGSALIASFADKPALIIQAGRAVWIENLAITGKNNWTLVHDTSHIDVLYDDSNFLVPEVVDSRYAPYAGICIDPFAVAPAPPPGPLYSGLEGEYLPSPGSSYISIERCSIYGFGVGIAISPNGFSTKPGEFTQNAENISIDTCSVASTKSAIAVCQDQSRAVSCRNLNVYGAKYAIDCTHYGKGSGCCPSLFNADIGLTKYIFNTFSFGSGAAFDSVYCEASTSIGVLGGGGTADGYAFNGCSFKLVYAPDRPSLGYHLVNLARATFNSCQFVLSRPDKPGTAPLWIYCGGGPMSFNDCLIKGVRPYSSPSFWIIGAATRASFNNTSVEYGPNGSMFSHVLPVNHLSDIRNQAVLPGSLIYPIMQPNPDNSPRWVASGLRYILLGSLEETSPTWNSTNGTMTFQPTTPGVVAPGDLVTMNYGYTNVIESYGNTPVEPVLGEVTSIDPQTGLATLSHVPEYVFSKPKPPDPKNTKLIVVGFYKIHLPTTGRVTNTDNTHIAFSPPISTAIWVVGDRIRAKEGFIRANTYVAAVQLDNQGNLQALTLSQPMTGTPENGILTLYDADVRIFTSTQVY
jgi:hypothetical protein